MRGSVVTRTAVFAREHLRAPFTLSLLIAVPAIFVISAAGVLGNFASALRGSLAGDAAAALSAGWAAAFISGALPSGGWSSSSLRSPRRSYARWDTRAVEAQRSQRRAPLREGGPVAEAEPWLRSRP